MAWRADCPTRDLVCSPPRSTNVEHKSAITDHADRHNCVIEREGAKVVDKETNRCARWIKESIWIRKMEPTMNRDEGGLEDR